jgi:hypothetical protein
VPDVDPAQRSRLLAVKLRALVSAHAGLEDPTPAAFPGGAAILDGDRAWVLLDTSPLTSFGAAMVWASRQGRAELHVVVDHDAGVAGILARRATCFEPAPSVWTAHGTALAAAPADPAAVPQPAEPAPALAELLVDAGLEVLVEGGVVRGELNGLEVARVVHGASSSGVPLEEPLLEVGVGQADRELTAMLHGTLAPTEQLARVIELVGTHRRPGAPPHPLNQLVPERWLRARLVAHPERIGLESLRPVETALPRPNLRDRGVAAALGRDPAGREVLVACSVGVDLDLVPHAADTRLAVAPAAELVLAVPERDASPVTTELAGRLARPARIVALEGDWRE